MYFLEWGCLLRKAFHTFKGSHEDRKEHAFDNYLALNYGEIGKTVTSLSKVFSKLPFQKTFIPLNSAAPTMSQARRRQSAKYQTMTPVSSSPLDRWSATLLKTQMSFD